MTQCERVLNYLREHGAINPLEAWVHVGAYRLGARIHELRQAGHQITKELIPVRNKFGEECRVAQYRLVKP